MYVYTVVRESASNVLYVVALMRLCPLDGGAVYVCMYVRMCVLMYCVKTYVCVYELVLLCVQVCQRDGRRASLLWSCGLFGSLHCGLPKCRY